MPSITVDPNTGQLLIDGLPADRTNALGSSGQYLFGDWQGVGLENPNDKYFSEYSGYLDEPGNWVSRWGPSVATKEKLGGLVQPGQYGIGGYSEIIDPSKLTWSDEFGVLTHPDNIADSDPGLRRRGLFAVGAIAGAGLAANAGWFGAQAAGGAGTTNAAIGYGLGGSAGEAAAVGGMGGMGGVAGSTLIPTAGMLAESAVPAGLTAADLMGPVTVNNLMSGATAPWWQTLGQGALNYATKNPLQFAQGVAGLLGAATSATGSSGSTGGSGGYQGPSGPVPSFDPVGNAGQFQQSQYQPMQFDPVPFMGGSMYYNQQQPNFMGSWGGFNQNAMNFGGGYTPTQFQGGGMPAQSYSNGGFGGNTGGGMGYAGGGPNPFMSNPFGMGQQQPQMQKPYMPPQFNMGQQTPQYGGSAQQGFPQSSGGGGLLGSTMGQYNALAQAQGGGQAAGYGGGAAAAAQGQPDGFGPADPSQNKYGRLGTENQMAQNAMAPNMTNREFMGYARYLPGSKSPLDPNFSQNLLAKSGGNWQSMVPQRAQAGFQQFMNTIGNPQSFSDYQNWMRNY